MAITCSILLLPEARKLKSGSEDNRNISLQEAETLGSKTSVSGFNWYIIRGREKKTQPHIGGCNLMALSDKRSCPRLTWLCKTPQEHPLTVPSPCKHSPEQVLYME